MKKKTVKKADPYKSRSLRIEDKVWDYFVKTKPRDKSWNLYIGELTDIIKYFKQL